MFLFRKLLTKNLSQITKDKLFRVIKVAQWLSLHGVCSLDANDRNSFEYLIRQGIRKLPPLSELVRLSAQSEFETLLPQIQALWFAK